jgi:hypothetical protein
MLTKPFTLALLLALGAHAAAADTDRHFINGERSTAQTPPPISSRTADCQSLPIQVNAQNIHNPGTSTPL